jgi:hypothetical protein
MSNKSDDEQPPPPPSLPDLSLVLSKTIPEMKDLLTLVQCPVCYETMTNPVMAAGTKNCGHNFCSLCVRKYLTYKQQCPVCLQPLHEVDLKVNRPLSDTIEVMTRLMPRLEAVVSTLKPNFTLPQPPNLAAAKKNPLPNSSISSSRPSTTKLEVPFFCSKFFFMLNYWRNGLQNF